MKCPKCDGEMNDVKFKHVEVDRCTECNGIWFDLLEAEDLKNLAGSEIIDNGDPKLGKKLNDNADINCPRCNTKMLRLVNAHKPHIWYEACPICYGTYLDAGEFIDLKKHSVMDLLKSIFTMERK